MLQMSVLRIEDEEPIACCCNSHQSSMGVADTEYEAIAVRNLVIDDIWEHEILSILDQNEL